MKTSIKHVAQGTSAPRNPFVAAALFKKAGSHRKGTGSNRQKDKMLLRKEY